MTAVGVVGLGTMGGHIAARLLETGYDVHGTDVTDDRAHALLDAGMKWHDTPRDTAQAADVVITMVTDDVALRAVTAGPDGVLAGLAPGRIYVDMSSVSPHASRELAEQVRSVGAQMLDAPVSGSVPQVEAGTLAIMVGGDEQTFHAVEPLLRDLGQAVTLVGGNGSGVLMKLAINISLAVQILAFSEGLLLAERGGIDRALAARVMSTSSIGSPMLQARVPLLLDLPPDAWFTVRLMAKDIGLAQQEANRASVAVPSAIAAANVLTRAMDGGYSDRDIAAVHDVLAVMSDEGRDR